MIEKNPPFVLFPHDVLGEASLILGEVGITSAFQFRLETLQRAYEALNVQRRDDPMPLLKLRMKIMGGEGIDGKCSSSCVEQLWIALTIPGIYTS